MLAIVPAFTQPDVLVPAFKSWSGSLAGPYCPAFNAPVKPRRHLGSSPVLRALFERALRFYNHGSSAIRPAATITRNLERPQISDRLSSSPTMEWPIVTLAS